MKAKSGTRGPRQRLLQRKATTFRFSAHVQRRLELLRKLRKAPLNQLVNQAVDQYVTTALAEEESNLTDTLRRIREARQSDGDFEAAIGEFVDSETALAAEDPVEGRIVDDQPRARSPKAGRHKKHAARTIVDGVLRAE